jgi:hypothetical protein
MNKVFLFIVSALSILMIASCSSCDESNSKPDVQIIDSGTEELVEQVISGSSWTIVLPIGWEREETTYPNIELVAAEKTNKSLLVFSKEPYTKSSDQFAIESFRTLRGEGAQLEETSVAIINNERFITAESIKGNIRMLVWLTVKNNFGYTILCGGSQDNIISLSDCQKIISRFKI